MKLDRATRCRDAFIVIMSILIFLFAMTYVVEYKLTHDQDDTRASQFDVNDVNNVSDANNLPPVLI